jgi:hypothetical protein
VPAVGQIFKQEDAEDVAEDCFRIVHLNASVKPRLLSSHEALKTGGVLVRGARGARHKYYVRNICLVREQTVQGGSAVLELVSVQNP